MHHYFEDAVRDWAVKSGQDRFDLPGGPGCEGLDNILGVPPHVQSRMFSRMVLIAGGLPVIQAFCQPWLGVHWIFGRQDKGW